MHVLYCDETNLEERAGDFLIYGGLALDASRVHELSRAIDGIRRTADIAQDFVLKFNPCPPNLSHEEFIAVKQAIIEAATQHEARLLVYLVLHDIANNPDEARRNGINTVCYHFDCLLNRGGAPGLVLIDRFTDTGNVIDAHLREKFGTGITGLPYTPRMRLRNIVGFHYSAIGQSHFPSVIDIILGSLRFAVNTHTRNIAANQPTSARLLQLIAPLFFTERGDGLISELSLLFSPKVIKVQRYRDKYQELKEYLWASGIRSEQTITDQRMH